MSTIRDICIDNKGGSARHNQPAELLITMSLVSREFHLFRSIKLGPSTVPVGVTRICWFLEFISADAKSEQNGLASYVQSLNIWTTNPVHEMMVLRPRSCVNCSKKVHLLAREGRFSRPFSYSITWDGPRTSLMGLL